MGGKRVGGRKDVGGERVGGWKDVGGKRVGGKGCMYNRPPRL